MKTLWWQWMAILAGLLLSSVCRADAYSTESGDWFDSSYRLTVTVRTNPEDTGQQGRFYILLTVNEEPTQYYTDQTGWLPLANGKPDAARIANPLSGAPASFVVLRGMNVCGLAPFSGKVEMWAGYGVLSQTSINTINKAQAVVPQVGANQQKTNPVIQNMVQTGQLPAGVLNKVASVDPNARQFSQPYLQNVATLNDMTRSGKTWVVHSRACP